MGIVLGCRCGEELFILGREEYWRKEGRTCFEGGVGGEELSLDLMFLEEEIRLIQPNFLYPRYNLPADKANLGVSEVPLGPLIRCITERNCLENSWTRLDRVFSVGQRGNKDASSLILPAPESPQ